MESRLVHIAISTNALASLIESGSIHAEDFKCLNADSKKTVWTLFLSALKATTTSKREHRGKIIMSDNENQEVLLMAIEYLKIQYADLRNPCIALYISRYYRLLSELNSIQNRQASYTQHSQSWLNCHTANAGYSQKMQTQLNDFVTLHESN